MLIERNGYRNCEHGVETQRTVDAPGMVISKNTPQYIGEGLGAVSVRIGEVEVSGNRISDTGGFGIVCRGNCRRVEISGNTFTSNSVFASDTFDLDSNVALDQNTFVDNKFGTSNPAP